MEIVPASKKTEGSFFSARQMQTSKKQVRTQELFNLLIDSLIHGRELTNEPIN